MLAEGDRVRLIVVGCAKIQSRAPSDWPEAVYHRRSMSTVIRVFVVGLMMLPATARADMAPRDIGGCRKVGDTCELDGRPGKCQTRTRIQRLPKPGGGTTTREREYVACVLTRTAPAKAEAKEVEPPEPASPEAASPPEPASGPVPTLPPEPVSTVPAAPAPVAPVADVGAPAPSREEGGACRVATDAPGLGLLVLLLLRRRRWVTSGTTAS